MRLRPKKRFGQHFLERAWAEKVVQAMAPAPSDIVLEIGPGRGAITGLLAARAAHVVAYEIDRDLAPALRAGAPPTLTVVEGDFLAQSPDSVRATLARAGVAAERLRVVGNLPYNVASPILFKVADLYAAGLAIADAVVMLQAEVAARLAASPGSKEYGVLTVLLGHRAEVTRLLGLPPGAFRPPPKVRSAVVRLRFHAPDPPVRSVAAFTELTQALFTRRRKTVANALQAYVAAPRVPAALAAAAIDGRRRPETLSIAELARLSDALI